MVGARSNNNYQKFRVCVGQSVQRRLVRAKYYRLGMTLLMGQEHKQVAAACRSPLGAPQLVSAHDVAVCGCGKRGETRSIKVHAHATAVGAR
jgi:hypothetical protein